MMMRHLKSTQRNIGCKYLPKLFNVCQTWIVFEGYIPSNGFLVLFPHGQDFAATANCSLLPCIMYVMIFWAGTQTQRGKIQESDFFYCSIYSS